MAVLNLTVPDFEHADDATLRRLLKSYVIQMNKKLDSVLSSLDTENFTDALAALLDSVVTADDLSTVIQQTNDAIALRASQIGVNALGERVTTAETTLTLKADSATLTSTANNLQTQLTAVPGQITAAVSELEDAIAYAGATPPADPAAGQCWENTGVTPYEILRWTGNGASTARRYAASKTGASVAIADLSDNHALAVTVKTVASQSGSGTPSPTNVRPIAGMSAATVRRNGKNAFRLLPSQTLNGITLTVNSDGSITLSGTATATAFFTATLLNKLPGTLVLSAGNATANSGVVLRAATAAGAVVLDLPLSSGNAVSAPFSGDISQAAIRVASGTVLSGFVLRPQLEVGSEATTFEAYEESDFVLTPDAALYGLSGLEDEIGNDGHVTHKTALITLTGAEAIYAVWTTLTNTQAFQFVASPAVSVTRDVLCSHFLGANPGVFYATDVTGIGQNAGGYIQMRVPKSLMTGWSDAWTNTQKETAFKAWLSAQVTAGTPVRLIVQRAAAVTAAVAPTQIAGINEALVLSSDGASLTADYSGSGWMRLANAITGTNVEITQDKFRVATREVEFAIIGDDGETSLSQIDEDGAYFPSLDAPDVAGRWPGPYTVTVNPALAAGGSNYTGLDALAAAIKNRDLDGDLTVTVAAGAVLYGSIAFTGLTGGRLIFTASASSKPTLRGTLAFTDCAIAITLENLKIVSPASATALTASSTGSAYVNGCEVTAGTSGTGILIPVGGAAHVNNTQVMGGARGLMVDYAARAMCLNTRGSGFSTEAMRCRGGTLLCSGTVPSGTITSEANGQVVTTSTTTNAGSGAGSGTDVTVTYAAADSGCYASGWLSGYEMRQGYTSAELTGCIWLDNTVVRAALAGKTVNDAKLTLRRKSGYGKSGAISLHLYGTTWTGKTGGRPDRPKDYGVIGTVANGVTGTYTIPAAAIADLVAGTINGFVLYAGDGVHLAGKTYSTNYGRLYGSDTSDGPKITVTYQ